MTSDRLPPRPGVPREGVRDDREEVGQVQGRDVVRCSSREDTVAGDGRNVVTRDGEGLGLGGS